LLVEIAIKTSLIKLAVGSARPFSLAFHKPAPCYFPELFTQADPGSDQSFKTNVAPELLRAFETFLDWK
jgi:hypothetical protein